MRNKTARQLTSPREFERLAPSPELPADAHDQLELMAASLAIDNAIAVSGISQHQSHDAEGRNRTLNSREISRQSAYEAGLASGREAGYQRGYREGFSDGFKFGDRSSGVGITANAPAAGSKIAEKRVCRLRGLPCASCGAATYGDEVQCSQCGIPKPAQPAGQSRVEEPGETSQPENDAC